MINNISKIKHFNAGIKDLVCVDLFSGAGGFSLAAINSGFKVAAAVEFNNHACSTYKKNLAENNKIHLYEGDIMMVDPKKVLKQDIGEKSECDLLLGGPPCQGFSVHRINNSGIDDPRNKLILKYFDFVRTIKPKVFLMENVPGMLWKRHENFIKEFYKQAIAAGYSVRPPVVVDAQNYGLPQRRKRVFILGTRKDIKLDIEWPPKRTHGDETEVSKNTSLLPCVTAESVFSMEDVVGDNNNVHMQHSEALIAVFKATPKNGGSRRDSGRVLDCHKNHDGHGDVYGRIDPNKPAPTMTTACINPSKGRFVHPTQDHGITVRQAARFQTFPDTFEFMGGLMAAGAQIGNAVPIKLGEILLTAIKIGLLGGPKNERS